MSRLDPLLRTPGDAPKEQIAEHMTKRIRRLIDCSNEIVVTELTEIRDECIAKAHATPFAINIIDQAIEVAKVKD
ncbi:hypothetical protein [Acinetobacter sp.]|uniref:hypothetical protein n=1 Tax=Acinetobacter sp. TaxID=472 RepID=UPI00388F77F7